MITTEEIKIPITDNLTSEYIEEYLKNMDLDILRWAITKIENNFYIISTSYIK